MKKFFQKLALWIGILFLALILFSFFLPREINVSRNITVDAPMYRVFEQVNDLRNWEKWSPWKRMDPMMEMTFSNPPVGEGAFYKWISADKRMGSGTMTLAKVTNDEEIVCALHRDDWGDASSTFQFVNKGKQIEVTWKMDTKVGVMPWSKYFAFAMKSEMKKHFDQGLKGIKFYAEKS